MRLAVVVVHYQTPELAATAVDAVLQDAAGSGLEIEGLVVDNGSDAAGRELLDGLPFARLDPGSNLGFAGGVNLGVARSRADSIVLMNADVRVLPGCLGGLVDSLRAGAAVAGPRFWWDDGQRLLLPPAEERSRTAELLTLAAARRERWAVRARRRWRRRARRHWEARRPLPSYALSGGLLALTRSAWERVGPFDEGFRLYFEETDWLRRAARAGLPARYVPAAGAVHAHGSSAVREARSGLWFAESARRFRERHYGRWFAELMETLDGRWRGPAPRARSTVPAVGLDLSGYPLPVWVEVSPNPSGFPAAAELLTSLPCGPWSLPAEAARRLAGAELALQVVDERGRELARLTLEAGSGSAGEVPMAKACRVVDQSEPAVAEARSGSPR